MNIFSLVRYLANWARFPDARDYLSRGQGIVERRWAALRYWKQHERCCKEFQRRALEGLKGGEAVILGAGRLNDIDIDSLAEASDHIHLFDIDPGSAPAWKKAARLAARHNTKVSAEVLDITGTILKWTSDLKEAAPRFRSLADSCAFLDSLDAPIPRLPVPRASIVLSVNVLSQLSVFWRDRVIERLAAFKILPSANPVELPPELERSLRRLGAFLERRHLDLMTECRPEKIILITDRAFHYYKPNRAAWQSEPALHMEAISIEHYQIAAADSWLWHLAPQWLEGEEFGVIHEVCAFDFRYAGRESVDASAQNESAN